MNKAQATLQISGASLSFIASAATAGIICRSNAGLGTPYRRIIFGVSIGDTLQSLGLMTGPFAIPTALRAISPLAHGNVTSCNINGISMFSGWIFVHFYTVLLGFYYLRKMKYLISNREFFLRYERKAHISIISFTIVSCIVFVARKSMNPLPSGGICYVSAYPPGCTIVPEIVGECTRGGQETQWFFYFLLGIFVVTIFLVLLCMVKLVSHAIAKNRIFTSSLRARNKQQRKSSQQPNESDQNYVARIFRRETVIQASLYTTAFLGVYFFIVLQSVLAFSFKMTIHEAFQIASVILYPFGGVFNMLIFSRPKVAMVRRAHPKFSVLQCQWIILRYGLDVPSREVLMQISPWFRKGSNQHEQTGTEPYLLNLVLPNEPPQAPFVGPYLNSLAVANGASQSFDNAGSRNICYRSIRGWDHLEGTNITLRPRSAALHNLPNNILLKNKSNALPDADEEMNSIHEESYGDVSSYLVDSKDAPETSSSDIIDSSLSKPEEESSKWNTLEALVEQSIYDVSRDGVDLEETKDIAESHQSNKLEEELNKESNKEFEHHAETICNDVVFSDEKGPGTVNRSEE